MLRYWDDTILMSRVAVVIPAFNRSELLEGALRSVLRQTRRPDEIIVVDDGSTCSLSEASPVGQGDGIRWVRLSENRGPAAARNAGVEASSSEWIMFLDSDDEWLPRKLECHVAWQESHPEFSVSQVRERWFWNGKERAKPAAWKQRGGDLFEGSIDRCLIGPSCVLITREVWDRFGGFDEFFRVCEDYELWLRLASENPIGLVEEDALVRKQGGHGDQLSLITPAMDRFRVYALMQMLGNGSLSAEKRALVARGVQKKSRILSAGAEKRGQEEWASGYRVLGETSWETMNEEEQFRWSRWSRTQCEVD